MPSATSANTTVPVTAGPAVGASVALAGLGCAGGSGLSASPDDDSPQPTRAATVTASANTRVFMRQSLAVFRGRPSEFHRILPTTTHEHWRRAGTQCGLG